MINAMLRPAIHRLACSQSFLFEIRFNIRRISPSGCRRNQIHHDSTVDPLAYELGHAHEPHNFFVIQPDIMKPVYDGEIISPVSLRLEEAIALVHTIPYCYAVGTAIVPTKRLPQTFFSKRALNKIEKKLSEVENVNALFIAADILYGVQQLTLEKLFGLPIFDRYSLILQIFRNNAKTKEAKIQLELAKIPYQRVRLKEYHDRSGIGRGELIGSETPREKAERILKEKKVKLEKEVAEIIENRDMLRNKRIKKKIPSVAVIGYTNCGKSTLIRTLTNDESIVVRDKLFATLDVTTHPVRLSSFNIVLLLDTIGFISDIPTTLIEAFNTTLREINHSDLLLHIYDVTHPDVANQIKTVNDALQELEINEKLINSIINVGNKIDKLQPGKLDEIKQINPDHLFISATEKTHLQPLLEKIDSQLSQNVGVGRIQFRVANGGQEFQYLHKESAIETVDYDAKDFNFAFITCFINEKNLNRFIKMYGDRWIVDKNRDSEGSR